MEQQTLLTQYLNSGRFEEARRLLEQQLQCGDLLDPRTDRLWALIADQIANAMQNAAGPDVTVVFWEKLRDFFITAIEPS
jgi:hypothetical protein